MCMTRNGTFQNQLTKGKLQLQYHKSFSGKSLFNTSQAVAPLPSNAPSINHLHPIRPIRTRENYSTAMPIPPQRIQVILLPPHRKVHQSVVQSCQNISSASTSSIVFLSVTNFEKILI